MRGNNKRKEQGRKGAIQPPRSCVDSEARPCPPPAPPGKLGPPPTPPGGGRWKGGKGEGEKRGVVLRYSYTIKDWIEHTQGTSTQSCDGLMGSRRGPALKLLIGAKQKDKEKTRKEERGETFRDSWDPESYANKC